MNDVLETATTPTDTERAMFHFAARLERLFTLVPDLIGFSVLERASLSAGREDARLDAELSVADVAVRAWPGAYPAEPAEEIAAELRELIAENPSTRAFLRGFAFARTFH